jgi:hypothetical protein
MGYDKLRTSKSVSQFTGMPGWQMNKGVSCETPLK